MGAELYLAYGVQGLRVRKFERENQPLITLELASAADAWEPFLLSAKITPWGSAMATNTR